MKRYNYLSSNNIITSVVKEIDNVVLDHYDVHYSDNKLSTVNINGNILVTFKKNINDEINEFFLHNENKKGIIISDINEDYDIIELYPKISEYNNKTNKKFKQTNDARNLINRFPISILREFGLENLHCSGEQAEITGIISSDASTQITFNYKDNKIYNVYGVSNNHLWKVDYVYINNKLVNILEYSLRTNALNNTEYMLDASFELKYLNDKVQYIVCKGVDFSKIELQYNSLNEFVAAYKISNVKTLWYSTTKNYLQFSDKRISFKYRTKSVIHSISQGALIYEYKYDITKENVYSYVIPGIITPDKKMYNLAMCFLDITNLNEYTKEINVKYNNVSLYTLIPRYQKKYIKSIDIYDINSVKVGYINYSYEKNKIKNIDTFYFNTANSPILMSKLTYEFNPYDKSDKTIKIFYNDFIIYSENVNGRIKEVIKNGEKFTEIMYNENNEPSDIINYELQNVLPEIYHTLKINEV